MTSSSPSLSHLDIILLLVGSPRRYHLLVAFLLCCMQFPVSFRDHLLSFYTVTPKHRCRAEVNLTLGNYDVRPIVTIGGQRLYSPCELYVDPLDHAQGTKPCDDGWEFLVQPGESSVVTEWELVCERESFAAMLPYLATVAALIGALVTGILADQHGRKYVLLFSLLFHNIFGIFLHFLPLYGIFATVFSLQSLLIAGIQSTSYLILIENLPTLWHVRASLGILVFQCIGQMILAVLARIVRHWRYLQLVISAPGVVVIGYFWLIPQSLAWLVLENRQHSAQMTLARFSKDQNLPVTSDLRMQILKSCRVARSMPGGYATRHRFETIICSARLRKLAFTQFFIWFVVSLTSKCAVEELSVLQNNPFSRLFIRGVLELAFAVMIYLAICGVGMKTAQGISLFIAGICCMFAAIVSHQVVQMRFRFVVERGLHNFAPLFALLGQSISGAVKMTLWLQAVKTFPTGVRALGLGLCMFWAGIADLFLPGIEELRGHSKFTVLALGGALSFVCGVLTFLLLPDSTERPLATIPEEVEVSHTKIINDSDLDFRDTSITSGFVPNITAAEVEEQSQSSISFNELSTASLSFLRRLWDDVRLKTQAWLHPPETPTPNINNPKKVEPVNVIMDADVFEPVTGFVFKYDNTAPAVTIADFEKEMSVCWKPNNDPFDKHLHDKHLSSLNFLYNLDKSAMLEAMIDIQNNEDDGNEEHGVDSTL